VFLAAILVFFRAVFSIEFPLLFCLAFLREVGVVSALFLLTVCSIRVRVGVLVFAFRFWPLPSLSLPFFYHL
jgi:hypothetical protein